MVFDFKHSRYNVAVQSEDNDSVFLANTNSRAIIEMPKSAWNEYENLFSSSNQKGQNPLLSKIRRDYLREVLLAGGFVVRKDADEFRSLEIEYEQSRGRVGKNAALTIAPTMRCNLACPYCYANRQTPAMSEEIQKSVVKFIEELIKQRSLDTLNIHWLGGEPTLGFNIILKLSQEIIPLCKSYDVGYESAIITNGTLVTDEMARKLRRECNVTSAQVTLDGFDHDKTRPWANPNETDSCLERAINGYNILTSHFNYVTARMNVGPHNCDIEELTRFLDFIVKRGINKKRVTLGRINSSFHSTGSKNETLTMERFGKLMLDWYKATGVVPAFPKRQVGGCGASKGNSFCIDPEGYLSKCWDYMGTKEECIGHIRAGMYSYNPCLEFDMFSPFKDPLCRDCKCLPICSGGCISRFITSKEYREDKCYMYKNLLEDYVKCCGIGLKNSSEYPEFCVK